MNIVGRECSEQPIYFFGKISGNLSIVGSILCSFLRTPANTSPKRSNRSIAFRIWNCCGLNPVTTSRHSSGVATGAPLLRLAASLDRIDVAVVGAHLSGQPLNFQLQERGATLVKTCKTASDYRLFALANTPKPGLLKEPGFEGPGIEVEVWSMPAREFGSFVGSFPGPLGIGTLTLEDGSEVRDSSASLRAWLVLRTSRFSEAAVSSARGDHQ